MSEAYIQVSVRLIVGLFAAAIGAFFGALVIAMVVSGTEAPETVRSVVRIGFVALAAGVTSRLGWYGIVETRRQTVSLLVAAVLLGLVGSWLGLLIGNVFFENTDLYVLNRDISGAGFFGAVFGCNLPSFVHAAVLARRREI